MAKLRIQISEHCRRFLARNTLNKWNSRRTMTNTLFCSDNSLTRMVRLWFSDLFEFIEFFCCFFVCLYRGARVFNKLHRFERDSKIFDWEMRIGKKINKYRFHLITDSFGRALIRNYYDRYRKWFSNWTHGNEIFFHFQQQQRFFSMHLKSHSMKCIVKEIKSIYANEIAAYHHHQPTKIIFPHSLKYFSVYHPVRICFIISQRMQCIKSIIDDGMRWWWWWWWWSIFHFC